MTFYLKIKLVEYSNKRNRDVSVEKGHLEIQVFIDKKISIPWPRMVLNSLRLMLQYLRFHFGENLHSLMTEALVIFILPGWKVVYRPVFTVFPDSSFKFVTKNRWHSTLIVWKLHSLTLWILGLIIKDSSNNLNKDNNKPTQNFTNKFNLKLCLLCILYIFWVWIRL